MFKGKLALQIYVVIGSLLVYGYIIDKLVSLNWFANVGFVTLVFYGFIALLFHVVIYNVIDKMKPD